MLSLAIPAGLPLDITFRSRAFYIVPRLYGPQAGRAIVGATVEHAGFDKTVYPSAIAALHAQAAALVPALADAPIVETWAGLRPATADLLPLLGAHPTRSVTSSPPATIATASCSPPQPRSSWPTCSSARLHRPHAFDLSRFLARPPAGPQTRLLGLNAASLEGLQTFAQQSIFAPALDNASHAAL